MQLWLRTAVQVRMLCYIYVYEDLYGSEEGPQSPMNVQYIYGFSNLGYYFVQTNN
jgi:hypothetical protein